MGKVKKNKLDKKQIKRYLMFISGLFLISLAFNLFLLPSNIVNGGVSGISIMDIPKHQKLLILTDAHVKAYPTLNQKIELIMDHKKTLH